LARFNRTCTKINDVTEIGVFWRRKKCQNFTVSYETDNVTMSKCVTNFYMSVMWTKLSKFEY
jgi:hypothetical protein